MITPNIRQRDILNGFNRLQRAFTINDIFLFLQKRDFLTSLAPTILSKKDPGLCSLLTGNCVLLGYYAASSGQSTPTFRGNLSVPSSRVTLNSCSLITGPTGCSETSVRNCFYSLRNSPEDRSSRLLRRGN